MMSQKQNLTSLLSLLGNRCSRLLVDHSLSVRPCVLCGQMRHRPSSTLSTPKPLFTIHGLHVRGIFCGGFLFPSFHLWWDWLSARSCIALGILRFHFLATIACVVTFLSTLMTDHIGRPWFQTLCSQCSTGLIRINFDPFIRIKKTLVASISNRN